MIETQKNDSKKCVLALAGKETKYYLKNGINKHNKKLQELTVTINEIKDIIKVFRSLEKVLLGGTIKKSLNMKKDFSIVLDH